MITCTPNKRTQDKKEEGFIYISRSCNSLSQTVHLIVPNFKEKRGLFSGLGEDLEIQRKGVFGGEKICNFRKAGSLAIGTDG